MVARIMRGGAADRSGEWHPGPSPCRHNFSFSLCGNCFFYTVSGQQQNLSQQIWCNIICDDASRDHASKKLTVKPMTDDSILNGEIKRGNWIAIYLNVMQIVYWESLLLDIQNDISKIRCQQQGETVITAESLFCSN